MSNDLAAQSKADPPREDKRGFWAGCLIIAALGMIAVFPWARDLPYTYVHKFPYHYFVDIPAWILRFLPPYFPSQIAFKPPASVELPPNLKGVLISLVVTGLACLLFVILYALRNTVPRMVQLVMFLINCALLILILSSICRWLLTPIPNFSPGLPQ